MLPNYRDFLVRQEQYQDLLRQAEKERLIKIARLQPSSQPGLARQTANWLGTYLVKWGLTLPANHSSTPGCCGDCCPVELKAHVPA